MCRAGFGTGLMAGLKRRNAIQSRHITDSPARYANDVAGDLAAITPVPTPPAKATKLTGEHLDNGSGGPEPAARPGVFEIPMSCAGAATATSGCRPELLKSSLTRQNRKADLFGRCGPSSSPISPHKVVQVPAHMAGLHLLVARQYQLDDASRPGNGGRRRSRRRRRWLDRTPAPSAADLALAEIAQQIVVVAQRSRSACRSRWLAIGVALRGLAGGRFGDAAMPELKIVIGIVAPAAVSSPSFMDLAAGARRSGGIWRCRSDQRWQHHPDTAVVAAANNHIARLAGDDATRQRAADAVAPRIQQGHAPEVARRGPADRRRGPEVASPIPCMGTVNQGLKLALAPVAVSAKSVRCAVRGALTIIAARAFEC